MTTLLNTVRVYVCVRVRVRESVRQDSSSGQIEKQHVVTSGQISLETCREYTHTHTQKYGCKYKLLFLY